MVDEHLLHQLSTPEGRRAALLRFLFFVVVIGIPTISIYAAVRLYVALIRYLERRD